MATTHVLCTGAVYIDTILTVPHFPPEDTKLRASALTKRRGGNTANTLQVLSQLLSHHASAPPQTTTLLHLLAVLPDAASPASTFIADSLPGVDIEDASLFRTGHQDAASSYIMASQARQSRTIVSINPLPEMSADEFEQQVRSLQRRHAKEKQQGKQKQKERWWFHFEGRVPHITAPCVHFVRNQQQQQQQEEKEVSVDSPISPIISVECEKPERSGLAHIASLADVVFYSKLWAKTNGFDDARSFLDAQRAHTRDGALLCCTWGADGATVVQKPVSGDGAAAREEDVWVYAGAWLPPPETGQHVVDTIGAGDTFIAGMLFCLIHHAHDWSLERKVAFANQVAGRKVCQHGFDGLGEDVVFT